MLTASHFRLSNEKLKLENVAINDALPVEAAVRFLFFIFLCFCCCRSVFVYISLVANEFFAVPV